MHILWYIRNEELFQALTPSPDEMFHHFWSSFHRNHIPSVLGVHVLVTSLHQISFVNWFAPIDLWLKFSSDGSMHGSGSAACGGVLHDNSSRFV